MTDNTDRKRKGRLAVFEHVPDKVRKVTSSRRTKKDADLIDDDDDDVNLPIPKKRNKGVRVLEEPLDLLCGWQNCGNSFEKYEAFIKHINDHIDNIDNITEERLLCRWENCSYATDYLLPLLQHAIFHGYHTRLKNIGSNVLQRIKLPECTQPPDFAVPVVSGYTCDWDDCDLRFVTIHEFLEHIRLHVHNNPKYCKKGEFIPCEWKGCKYKFASQYKLSDHLRSHTKERMVACPTCGYMFSTKTKFYDHRKRQLPVDMQSYQCSQCSKLFPSERLLRDHMRSHVNHYKCTMCDMTCPKPSALAAHIRFRHLNERPFKCNLCEYASVSKQTLEEHLITHCAEKLLVCEDCGARYRSLYGLDRHYQIEHGTGWVSLYECQCCQKRFNRGNLLTRHLITKHNFHWPSGHSRFRYKEDSDGIFRLQTVRYESLEVTQQMINTTNMPPSLQQTSGIKFDLKRDQDSPNKLPSYVLMISQDDKTDVDRSVNKNVVITISDVDEKGNVVSSETIESDEIICTPEDMKCLASVK